MGGCLEPAAMIICMSWLAWHPFPRHVLINEKLASRTLLKRTFSILSIRSCAPKNTYKPPNPNQDMFIPSWMTWALVSGVGNCNITLILTVFKIPKLVERRQHSIKSSRVWPRRQWQVVFIALVLLLSAIDWHHDHPDKALYQNTTKKQSVP